MSSIDPVYITKWEDFLSSPDYPVTYPANASLTWIKSVSPGNRVRITIFTLQVRSGVSEGINCIKIIHGKNKYRIVAYNLPCAFLPFKFFSEFICSE